MKLKGIIFDLDGTLIDSKVAHVKAWIEACKLIGLGKLKDEDVVKHFGKTSIAIAEALLKEHGVDVKLAPRLADLKDKLFFEKYYKLVKPYEFLNELLRFLKERQVRICIVSSNPREAIFKILRFLSIVDYVDCVVGQDEVKEGKPSPEPILLALKRLKLEPKEVIVVGDSIYDVIAAKRANIIAVGVTHSSKSPNELKEAGALSVVRDLKELFNFLKSYISQA